MSTSQWSSAVTERLSERVSSLSMQGTYMQQALSLRSNAALSSSSSLSLSLPPRLSLYLHWCCKHLIFLYFSCCFFKGPKVIGHGQVCAIPSSIKQIKGLELILSVTFAFGSWTCIMRSKALSMRVKRPIVGGGWSQDPSMVNKSPFTTYSQVKNTLQEVDVSTIKRRLHKSK